MAIEDYGTVNWKSRKLEGIVLRATIKLGNAESGEYKDECFLLSAVLDGKSVWFEILLRRATTKLRLMSGALAISLKDCGLPSKDKLAVKASA